MTDALRSGPIRRPGAGWGGTGAQERDDDRPREGRLGDHRPGEHVPDEEERLPPSPRPAPPPRRTSRRPTARQLLRRGLASPAALRQAFLLHEVLGPPVSLRDEQGHVPR